MDRADTLRKLDALIEPDGALMLFNDVRPHVPENIWYKPNWLVAMPVATLITRSPAARSCLARFLL
jgi:hypothetical protein